MRDKKKYESYEECAGFRCLDRKVMYKLYPPLAEFGVALLHALNVLLGGPWSRSAPKLRQIFSSIKAVTLIMAKLDFIESHETQ